jgi:hypothetical protein
MTLREAVLDLHKMMGGVEGYKFCGEGKDEIVLYYDTNISQEAYIRIPNIHQGWHVTCHPMGEIRPA